MSGFRSDHMIIRDYVTANDHLQYQQLPEGVVCILLTHSNLEAKHLDIRLDLHLTIEAVKEKFRTHIGTPPEFQRLILKERGNVICEMSDNSRMLGFYSVTSGMEIHVLDTDPFSLSRGGGLTDVSLVEKYRMSDESYDSRKGTMREFIRQKRENDPNYKLKPKSSGPGAAVGAGDTDGAAAAPPGVESVEGIAVGMRCEVSPGARRGLVMFIGEVEGLKAGFWVGVRFDEPVGLSNGTVKGNKIFDCEAGFGGFVRGKNTKVGDFPERDIMCDSDHEHEHDHGATEEEEEDEL